jgi:hypothetical protein
MTTEKLSPTSLLTRPSALADITMHSAGCFFLTYKLAVADLL